MEIKKFSSDSILEDIMCEALTRNGIPFDTQVSLYESGDNFHHKYVLDFLIDVDGYKINIETDGSTHFTRDAMRYDVERDIWIKRNKCADMVLRYTTSDVMHRIDSCMNEVKVALMAHTNRNYELVEIPQDPEIKVSYGGYITNVDNGSRLMHINIYSGACSNYSSLGKGGISYEMEANEISYSKTISSAYTNVNMYICQALSIYEPLRKLNKNHSYQLTIYSEFKWIVYAGNMGLLLDSTGVYDTKDLWIKILRLLDNHNYRFKLLPKKSAKARDLKSKARKMQFAKGIDRKIYHYRKYFMDIYFNKEDQT